MLPLVWADRAMTLVDIVADKCLPAVAKISADSVSRSGAGGSGLDIQQPLLLYRENRTVRVVARNVSSLQPIHKEEEETCKDGGAVVVLPINYIGWFRVLDGKTAPIETVANVARAMPVSFLSVRNVSGLVLAQTKAKKDDKSYEKKQVTSGVFIVKNIIEDYIRYTVNNSSQKCKLLRCLACVSENGTDVLFTLDTEGEFYITEGRKSHSKSSKSDTNAYAFTLKDLVMTGAFTKPLVISTLIGKPPSKPCGYTGVMRVVDIIKDRTIIAATLDGSQKMLELPVLPFPKFIRALNGTDVLKSGTLKAELSSLSEAADAYAKEIKIRQNFKIDTKTSN